MKKFVSKGSHNLVLDGDGFYLSYNPAPFFGIGAFAADDGGDETAICAGEKFYILNGDFRAEYGKLVENGLETCLKFFYEHQGVRSSWSDR